MNFPANQSSQKTFTNALTNAKYIAKIDIICRQTDKSYVTGSIDTNKNFVYCNINANTVGIIHEGNTAVDHVHAIVEYVKY